MLHLLVCSSSVSRLVPLQPYLNCWNDLGIEMITAFELHAFGNILLDFGGFCFIFFYIKMLLCGVGGISSAGWWSEDIKKMRAIPPYVKMIFCLQFGVSSAAANIINQGFYHITNAHFKMDTCFCINEFSEHRCGGKESQSFEYVYWSNHYHFKVFFLLLSLASSLI